MLRLERHDGVELMMDLILITQKPEHLLDPVSF